MEYATPYICHFYLKSISWRVRKILIRKITIKT